MSELGCCFASQDDKTEMWGALFVADSVRMDLARSTCTLKPGCSGSQTGT